MACRPVKTHLGPEQRRSRNANENENKRQFKEKRRTEERKRQEEEGRREEVDNGHRGVKDRASALPT